jgi:hypothetical protein
MAKFDFSRIDATYTDRIIIGGSELIQSHTIYGCWHCGEPTEWVEINFSAHLCSDECLSAKIDEYLEATRQ